MGRDEKGRLGEKRLKGRKLNIRKIISNPR